MERIPLHSWQMGLSIQYHVTIINQLNDLNLMGYYIISNSLVWYYIKQIMNVFIRAMVRIFS